MRMFVISLLLSLSFWNCQSQPIKPLVRQQYIMGSEATIQSQGLSLQEIQELFTSLKEQELLLSTYIDESPVSRLNRGEEIQAPADLREILGYSEKINHETEGLFDIRIGRLVDEVYGFKKQQKKPSTDTIQKGLNPLRQSSFDFLKDDKIKTPTGVKLDFGGIGKGYAIWKAIGQFDKKAQWLSIAISGDIYCSHSCPIEIESPFEDKKSLFEFYTCKESSSISTSGNYRNFIQTPETNHLLHPKNGMPQQYTAGLTVVTMEPGYIADALATALAIAEPSQRKRIAKKYELSYFHIDSEGRTEKGPNFNQYFCKFKRK